MDKSILNSYIDSHKDLLTGLSDTIWDYAELSIQEYRSAESYISILKDQGFRVEEKLAGIPTAFSGSFGQGKPVIGILGEYDALSGLSQAACVTQKQAEPNQSNGHGCGHNLLGAGSLGAAIAIKQAIENGILSGTVVFYGCPGEEGCAGKTFMARDGLFRDLDAAICWHPGDVNAVTTGSCAACLQLEYTFTGISAHAAGDPENGRSALDAAELMNVGVQFLREHISKTASIHYAFSDAGGISPNVVQPVAKVIYMIRETTVRRAKALVERVNRIAQGAALMTDTQLSVCQLDGTSNTLSNTVMEHLIYENLCHTTMVSYSDSEQAYAAALKESFPVSPVCSDYHLSPAERTKIDDETENGKRPLNDFVIPYHPSFLYTPGSTDVGDVSWLTPTAQFTAATWVSGSPGHSWQNVAIGKHSIAHKGMLYAAKVMAGTVADMMDHPDILKKIREEFDICASEGYDCPIDNRVTIPTI